MSPPTLPSTRSALACLALATLLPSLGSSIANVALPDIARDFAADFDAAQWVVLAYLGAMTATMLFAGRVGDRLGRRRLLVVGLVVMTVASLAAAAAPWLGLLVVARAAQGAGAAVVLALAMAFVADAVPAEKTGRAMGLLGTMSAVGTALGPSLGGVLVAGFGWRSVFVVGVPLGLAALALARRSLPADAAAAAPTARGQAGGRPVRALVANLLVSAVLMATLVVGPFYLSHDLGLDAAAVGAVMSVGPIAAALLGVPAGRVVDRFGAPRAVRVGLAGIALGALLLAALPASSGISGYVLPVVVITASYALFQAANNSAVMRGVAADRRGAVSAALNLSRNLGLIGGTALMGAVFTAAGLHATFGLAVALMLLALVVVSARRARRTRPTQRAWWTVPALLIALSAVPALFGVARLAGLANGTVPPDEHRFVDAPLPVVAHVVGALLFSLLGAFQLSAHERRRWPRFHRVSGRIALAGGLVVAASGLWMTAFYPFSEALQGPLLYTVRLLVGVAMLASLVLAFTTIRRGDVAAHRAWMIRAYALGLGAGTQAVMMLPWTLAFGMPTHLPYEILMTLAWAVNLVVAERVIKTFRRESPPRVAGIDYVSRAPR